MESLKFKRIFIVAATGLLLVLNSSCSDDKELGGGSPLQHDATVYDAAGSIYAGKITTATAQYATTDGGFKDGQDVKATINGGKLNVTLPAVPTEEALFDGKGWGEDMKGIAMAHYSFEGIGVGKTYTDAAHLELYWQKEGVEDMRAGWYWADPEDELYASLQEMLDAGYKLYVADLIDYNMQVLGTGSEQSIEFMFNNDVAGLSEANILIYPDEGAASLEGEVTGNGNQWEANINTSAEGTVNVQVDKWGVSRRSMAASVDYFPPAQGIPSFVSRASWMSKVDRNKPLNQLAIPGTHDSGTYIYPFHGAIKCQYSNKTIYNQLMDGIRYLDIRVGYNGVIYHGDIAMLLNLNEVIEDCIRFLKTYENEVILVSLSWEGLSTNSNGKIVYYTKKDFQNWCSSAFEGNRKDYWYLKDDLCPTIPLHKVRKKMVLVNGHDTGKKGLSIGEFIKQNEWDIGDWTMSAYSRADKKYYAIKRFIDEAWKNDTSFNVSGEKYYTTDKDKKNNKYYTYSVWGYKRNKVSGTWTDTYTNALGKILYNGWNKQFNFGYSVKYYADLINGWYHHPNWQVTNYPRGIQLMDYYHQENVDNVIGSNFK